MVSAGLDTVPGNLIMHMAFLSTTQGQAVQEKALDAIAKVYPDGDAWEKCLVEEKVPYITAMVKETLRYWTVIPICLPRRSIRDISYKDSVIPAGTTFFMVCLSLSLAQNLGDRLIEIQNAYAADYDQERFKDPYSFVPERYLDDSETGTPHYGYGAGSRMCAGSHLANRELYTAYIRLIAAFEILPAQDLADRPIMDAIECNSNPTSLTTDPKPFKVGLRARNETELRGWIAASEERTRNL